MTFSHAFNIAIQQMLYKKIKIYQHRHCTSMLTFRNEGKHLLVGGLKKKIFSTSV